MKEDVLQKYAELAVRVGVNIQPGQLLVIGAPVGCANFARHCAREAYRAGAGRVRITWNDELAEKLAYENEKTEDLKEVMEWEVQRERDYVNRGYAFLKISAATPGLLGEIGGEKLSAVSTARRKALEPFDDYHGSNHGQWCIVSVPTPGWAQRVFPQLAPEQAVEQLWRAVLSSVRVGPDNDAVAQWQAHNASLQRRSDTLNRLNFESLHFQNSLGTNLTVRLVAEHVWVGGGSTCDCGAYFTPNMPTEEVFTMPDKFLA